MDGWKSQNEKSGEMKKDGKKENMDAMCEEWHKNKRREHGHDKW
jgi:hypothetical protein